MDITASYAQLGETKGLRKARALPLETINKDKHYFRRSGAGLTICCNKHEGENTQASGSFSLPHVCLLYKTLFLFLPVKRV